MRPPQEPPKTHVETRPPRRIDKTTETNVTRVVNNVQEDTGSVDSESATSSTYTNPLNALAQVAAKLDIRIPSTGAISEPDLSMQTTSTTNNSESTGLSSTTSARRTTGTAKKIVKMRPGPVRNGRQVYNTTNGTTAEFKAYYESPSLTKEQWEGYDKEAAGLVTLNAWNKDAFNGPML
ncbi:hypothetical protein L210DRAFT_3503003 [Boletus edulis BED1]|uniref:Uncharacterized protein n=1 Tax=Boletus edulis BED1 TaxID=1328754 RepID=A0AAD4GHT2_BOLED|nr:hypothetical protein L210DRAFT_3503003 [Boletus edulis BED1]